ncbi:hypothetical protein [Bythopirellula goksoeyrii]|uniref:Uncharacterized protein n=1 Tax=Bythopirellula goksoeyrii TaxID=1400387 RepID=A0A5B9QJY0_9BACT|nr:hypothetical protein [Bythopirellula goksoeyrii]QEG37346.1 hypothetical protein Pr1d_46870 [Bythopirellula goksoeyrii]
MLVRSFDVQLSLLALLIGGFTATPSLGQLPARSFAPQRQQNYSDVYDASFFSTGSDLNQAMPVQFQSGARATGSGRTSARQASLSGSGQRTPQSFAIRLARAPNMMGDLVGQSYDMAEMDFFVGRSVHHITSVNDFHLIDETGPKVLYVGGPGGSSPGSFFVPGPTPPAPDLVEGLSSNIPGIFRAESTFDDFVDVYNDELDVTPDISDALVYNIIQEHEIVLPNPAAADFVGRVRIQDNNSPLPKDRVYFDYNYFHNVPLNATGVDVNRFAPGFEKTFLNKMASIDVRVPMAQTLDSTMLADGVTDISNTEFGNLALISKFLLTSTDTCALAAGLGLAVPTADDMEVNLSNGTELIEVENDSTHLLPYIAALYTPERSNTFVLSYLTLDFDSTGNDVLANVNGTGLEKVGVLQDQHLLTFSFAIGSWCYENYAPGSMLKRIGWSMETHYTTTLNDSDTIVVDNFQIGTPGQDLDLVNEVVGGHVLIGKTLFTGGYAVPLTSADRVFDGELRFFANRFF